MIDRILKALRHNGPLELRQAMIDDAIGSDDTVQIEKVDLSEADMSGLSLSRLKFVHCDCRGISATGTRMPSLNDCRLDASIVTNANFLSLRQCSFRAADVRGALLPSTICDCCFDHAQLDGSATLESDVRWMNTSFVEAHMHDVDFAGAQLVDCSFIGADFMYSRLSRIRLISCDVSKARIARSNLVGAHVEDINMATADVQESVHQLPHRPVAMLAARLEARMLKCPPAMSWWDCTNTPKRREQLTILREENEHRLRMFARRTGWEAAYRSYSSLGGAAVALEAMRADCADWEMVAGSRKMMLLKESPCVEDDLALEELRVDVDAILVDLFAADAGG